MRNDSPPSEKLLTKGEVAQLCRVEIRTVDRWVAAGKIKCYRIPSGRLLFRSRDVLMVAERQRNGVRVDAMDARARPANRSQSTTRPPRPPATRT
jgi:excisionase family DNA binding protein